MPSTETTQRMAMIVHLTKQVMNDPASDPQIRQWAENLNTHTQQLMLGADPITNPNVTYAVETLEDILSNPDDHDLDQDEGEQIEAALTLLREHGQVITYGDN